ncbi:uncharacterized protein BX664DRAFT_332167 [Halteromyces radiatus]|uniref:uncharacterized protein n=1 Tax=Halteromyces radiatus TaxID=101107 RepID=UPI00221EED27|nr:uncharacterized protein BX664DRAFT_332167 [Halteromyces radiatus]KAI8089103.1 hypothetical protein BX664DRAFT_332167 [Halteromyces radiatus]
MNSKTAQTVGKYAMQYLLESQSNKNKTNHPPPPPPPLISDKEPPRRWWSRRPRPEDILTKEERKILKSVKNKAYFLDRGVNCCCFQIGFDGLIGFIPVVGDFIGLIFALFLIERAMDAHLPSKLINQMLINVAVDFLIGLVPIVGDILDIMYKCNTRNALLLEEYLIQRRQHQLRKKDSEQATSSQVVNKDDTYNRSKVKDKMKSPTPSPLR